MNKILKSIFSIYAFVVFLVVMIIIFPLVIIASFFGQYLGGNWINKFCSAWANICLFLWGIKHRNILEAPLQNKHAVIFVLNHSSYIDIPIMMKIFTSINIRVLGKSDLAKVPIFGYIYKRAAVMVDRSSKEARANSLLQLKHMLNKNCSIAIYPEGTFNMSNEPLANFYDGAFKIAVETNTPIQPILLLDAIDRLHYKSVFSFSPGKSRAVIMNEILPGSNVDLLKETVYNTMKNGLIKHNASWIKNN
jgi:1-acyl-sn-glycerol-3-phosphate acyltransferase